MAAGASSWSGRRRLVMGCAIVACMGTGHRGIDNGWLAVLVIVITLAVIAIALIVSVLDSRLRHVPRCSPPPSHEPTAS